MLTELLRSPASFILRTSLSPYKASNRVPNYLSGTKICSDILSSAIASLQYDLTPSLVQIKILEFSWNPLVLGSGIEWICCEALRVAADTLDIISSAALKSESYFDQMRRCFPIIVKP